MTRSASSSGLVWRTHGEVSICVFIATTKKGTKSSPWRCKCTFLERGEVRVWLSRCRLSCSCSFASQEHRNKRRYRDYAGQGFFARSPGRSWWTAASDFGKHSRGRAWSWRLLCTFGQSDRNFSGRSSRTLPGRLGRMSGMQSLPMIHQLEGNTMSDSTQAFLPGLQPAPVITEEQILLPLTPSATTGTFVHERDDTAEIYCARAARTATSFAIPARVATDNTSWGPITKRPATSMKWRAFDFYRAIFP